MTRNQPHLRSDEVNKKLNSIRKNHNAASIGPYNGGWKEDRILRELAKAQNDRLALLMIADALTYRLDSLEMQVAVKDRMIDGLKICASTAGTMHEIIKAIRKNEGKK